MRAHHRCSTTTTRAALVWETKRYSTPSSSPLSQTTHTTETFLARTQGQSGRVRGRALGQSALGIQRHGVCGPPPIRKQARKPKVPASAGRSGESIRVWHETTTSVGTERIEGSPVFGCFRVDRMQYRYDCMSVLSRRMVVFLQSVPAWFYVVPGMYVPKKQKGYSVLYCRHLGSRDRRTVGGTPYSCSPAASRHPCSICTRYSMFGAYLYCTCTGNHRISLDSAGMARGRDLLILVPVLTSFR